MSLWRRLLRYLESRSAPRQAFHLDEDLIQSLQVLAEREKRPEEEVAADLLAFALARREIADDNLKRWESLSTREQQVAALVCLDYTSRQIAARLFISPDTVKTHLSNAFRKFNVHNKAELRQALADWDFSDWRDAKF
jgi:DNA-binding CsgD family transcriptional regulator